MCAIWVEIRTALPATVAHTFAGEITVELTVAPSSRFGGNLGASIHEFSGSLPHQVGFSEAFSQESILFATSTCHVWFSLT